MKFLSFIFRQKILTLTFITSLMLYVLPENFKLFLLFCGISFFLYVVVTKNVFFSLCAMLFITQHFLSPGKYYSFMVIEAGQLRAEPYKTYGVADGYGLTASDIFAFTILIYGLRQLLFLQIPNIKYQFTKYIGAPLHLFSLSCWILYALISFYSSQYFSFYPIFSLINLFQYCKIFIFYISFSFIFAQKNIRQFTRITWLVSGVSFTNVAIALSQFTHDVRQSLSAERYIGLYVSTEHELRISAPTGFYLHANQFALFCLLWSYLFLFVYQKTKQKFLLFSIAVNLLGVLISQGRTVWFLSLLTYGSLILYQKTQLTAYVRQHRKTLPYGLIGLLLMLLFIYPRLSSMQYTFDGGSASIRLEMLSEGMDALQINPWFGFGIHTGVRVLYDLFPSGYVQDFPFEIHNAYLQIALESGLVAMTFFFLPFFAILRKTILTIGLFHASPKYILFPSLFSIGAILVYYIFQPHGGRLEIPLLGVILGFSSNLFLYEKGKKFT